jgi:hypothetical protein
MSGETTYEALNISSRSFILGDKTMLPKIPQTITETEKQIIEKHKWGDFFQITEVEVEGPISNVDVPHVTPDNVTVGDTLNCTMGNWNGVPTTYDYNWYANDTELLDSQGPDYIVQNEDVGKTITCVVIAGNDFGSVDAPASNGVTVS